MLSENVFAPVYDGNIFKIIDVIFEQRSCKKFLPNAVFDAIDISFTHIDAECFVGIGTVAACTGIAADVFVYLFFGQVGQRVCAQIVGFECLCNCIEAILENMFKLIFHDLNSSL